MWYASSSIALTALLASVSAQSNGTVNECPGYTASNVKTSPSGLTADLKLAGEACNTYGDDLEELILQVEYQTENRLHVKIYDPEEQVYQIPRSVLDPPQGLSNSSNSSNALKFSYTESPFSFAVVRTDSGETLFNTSGSPLIFESQYLGLRTSLPENPYIYGLGEDSDAFRRNTTNYTRTLWSRDAPGAPPGTNLYGNHPVYFEHRAESSKTHGVFLFNSNGMDIKINNTEAEGQYLEYNTLGGVVDLYFLAGPTPQNVAQQYSEVVGKPAMMSYWHFGYHQCKYGYNDAIEVAQVISNYSNANIPLETMWTDIDYMYLRKVFTLDPERFPLKMVRDIVQYLYDRDQHYIVMVDPAVSKSDNGAYNRGIEQGAFLQKNGAVYEGAVWPGPAVFPDWFNEDTQAYWDNEFAMFFDPEEGVDIDALWIDMNEAANFCPYPCTNATQYSEESGNPPEPPPLRTFYYPLPGWPAEFQPPNSTLGSAPTELSRRAPILETMPKRQTPTGKHQGLPGRELTYPKYTIGNVAGALPNKTIDTDLIHANGLTEYDTHNLYGTMMSSTSRHAMLARRPSVRPLVITRSTFAGAGSHVGHWLGDNLATWSAYRESIYQIQSFSALFQVPMVGADVCGFIGNTTEQLCSRWARLGAFYPFFRNHADLASRPHEFYRWDSVAAAAREAIDLRYRLLDYIYTAFHESSSHGTPLINPLFFLYPEERGALDVGLQFFYGESILVSPVTQENSTSVQVYLPDDVFYDLATGAKVEGSGQEITLEDVGYGDIPVHVRGGSIVPMRVESGNTTTQVREKDFELLVAPGRDGKASGKLYLDDGDSLVQEGISEITFDFDGERLLMDGTFGYDSGRSIVGARVLGVEGARVAVEDRRESVGLIGPAEIAI